MCGIAGIYELNGHRVSLEMVETMGNLTYHRGPDNFSFLGFNEHLGLSHNRLSFLDLSAAANQPFKNENYALVYNGEIYNFREIRERLTKTYNIRFETTSDTEVLFYSLIHDGIENCLKQLRGMFAFAFYDKIKDELWLARDRLGIKPLYYYQKNKTFYWSSEIKALAQTLNLKPDPLKTLFSINGSTETSNEYTLFNDILPVKPGSFLKIKADHRTPQEFFYYKCLDDFEPERYRDLERKSSTEILAEFENLLTSSIQSMLVSDVPLGSFVSGGIDSSLISAIANKSYPNLKLFTANVLGKFSEYKDAKTLSDYLGRELLDYKFEPEMMLRDWAEVTYFYECPIIIHTNAIPFSNVARLARDSNVKAVLTGEGADELFLGYPRLLTERYNWLALLPVSFVKSFYKFVPGLDEYLFPNRKQTTIEFANQLIRGFESPCRDAEMEGKFDFLSETKRREQMLTSKMLGDHLVGLLHRNDRMGMMASIEARFPFLNEELVKFAINLPAKFKIRSSRRWHNYKHPFLMDKWVVRKTAEKYLPKSLAHKKKNGFPMSGHKYVRVKKGFFNNGWVAENLALTDKKQKFMLESQNPYFVTKLASIEIFGRIYGREENIEQVKNHILTHAEMIT
ncbi:MAG: asparagine synthase (glutamine-hydrolyzing) [Actinomycetota bacterium]